MPRFFAKAVFLTTNDTKYTNVKPLSATPDDLKAPNYPARAA